MPDFSWRKPEDCPTQSDHDVFMYCANCSYRAEPTSDTNPASQPKALLLRLRDWDSMASSNEGDFSYWRAQIEAVLIATAEAEITTHPERVIVAEGEGVEFLPNRDALCKCAELFTPDMTICHCPGYTEPHEWGADDCDNHWATPRRAAMPCPDYERVTK
jgi:hypothetical protein